MEYKHNTFKIYTDGACVNNGKPNARCSIGIHFSNNNVLNMIFDIESYYTNHNKDKDEMIDRIQQVIQIN